MILKHVFIVSKSILTYLFCVFYGYRDETNRNVDTLLIRDMIEKLDEAKKRYFTFAFRFSPDYYIVPRHHLDLIHSNKDNPKIIQITGPKGVGKSTSLFVFALKMTIAAEVDDPIIVYLSERSEGLCQEYFQSLGLGNCTLSSLARTVRDNTSKHFVFCIDLGLYTIQNDLLKVVDDLAVSLSTHIRLVIAHSSGAGYGPRQVYILQCLQNLKSVFVTAQCFDDAEAKVFVDKFEITAIPMDAIVKKLTEIPY